MKPIMIQGTGSETGKTTLVSGLCRLFADRGLRVAPFKSQNMSLNCFVTDDGGEVARSIAVQAGGARQTPVVHMNPLLLKPKADDVCQLVVHGKAVGDVSARDYFLSDRLQPLKLAAIRESFSYLRDRFDLIVAEGAGSCAEPNLRRLDVVNMGLAELIDADVYVAADIDKGGVFASLLGSLRVMELTAPGDVARVKGFVINKFRGDPAVLRPGIEFLERETGIDVVGVVPLLGDLALEEEDRLKERGPAAAGTADAKNADVEVAVVYLPHIANAGDFGALAAEPGVRVRYVKTASGFASADAVILPGSKNTVWDLEHLRRNGVASAVTEAAGRVPVFGVCGGYQMLARVLHDPEGVESDFGTVAGLGLLDAEVRFAREKTLANRVYTPRPENPFAAAGPVRGYEIHCGTVRLGECLPLYEHDHGLEGAFDPARPVFGTFIHDLFNNPAFTRAFVNHLRRRKGLAPADGPLVDPARLAEDSYARLAAALDAHTRF